jgi:hypothetical protein
MSTLQGMLPRDLLHYCQEHGLLDSIVSPDPAAGGAIAPPAAASASFPPPPAAAGYPPPARLPPPSEAASFPASQGKEL